ncbi:extracellular solute-binding protein [Kribbella qitaiheensis]|nr:extracellular solute-binding protein [Kribbella qitaiheensis]
MPIHQSARRGHRLIAALVLLPAFLAAVACGPDNSGGGGVSAADDPVDGSTISFGMVNGLVPAFQKYVDAYQKQFPDRKVTIQSLPDGGPDFIQQLSTQALSRKLPDLVFNVDNAANRLAAANVTSDLASWLEEGKAGLKGSNFLPQFLGQYRPLDHPEQITGLPVSADAVVLFYNKKLLAQYGEPIPSPSWTWSDLYRVANNVQTKSGGKTIGLAAPLGAGTHPEIYNPVIQAHGGYVYDPKTNKSGIGQPAAVGAWTELLNAYGHTSPAYSANDSAQAKFENGNVAMAFSVHATVPTVKSTLKDDWDVQTMPTVDGKPTAGGGSYGLSIGKTSEHKNAAWAFLSWFYDRNGGMKLAQATGQVVPPTADGLDSGSWRDATPPPANDQAFVSAAKTAVLAVQLPGKAQGELDASVLTAIQQVVLQHRSVADAFGDAEKKVNQALQAAK